MQYLEKIFQIPFTLPPVDQTGYTTMIEALTGSALGTDRSAPGTWRTQAGAAHKCMIGVPASSYQTRNLSNHMRH